MSDEASAPPTNTVAPVGDVPSPSVEPASQLIVQVLDSRRSNLHYVVLLRLTNHSLHGITVFEMESERPSVQPTVERVAAADISFPTDNSKLVPALALPFVIRPQAAQDVRLYFSAMETAMEIGSELYGRVKIHYEILADCFPNEQDVTVRFRNDQPAVTSFVP